MKNLSAYVLFAHVLSLASLRLEPKDPPGLSGASGHALSSGDLRSRKEDSFPDDGRVLVGDTDQLTIEPFIHSIPSED